MRRAIDRVFVRGATGRRWDAVRSHIEQCDDCRAYYDRLESSLRPGGSGELGVAALERVGAAVMRAAGRPRQQSRRLVVGAALAAASTAIVLLLVLTRGDAPIGGETLTARGGHDARPLVPGERDPGVRFFCIVSGDNGGRVLHEMRAVEPSLPAPLLSCTIDAELQLAYSLPSLGGMTMVAYSRDSAGLVRYYAPTTEGAPALALAADVIDEPLSWSTRLAVRHHPGVYDLRVGFYAGAITAGDAVRGAVSPVYELHARLRVVPSATDGGTP